MHEIKCVAHESMLSEFRADSNATLIWPKPSFSGQRENRGEEVKMEGGSVSEFSSLFALPFGSGINLLRLQ
jgi:hypothetical protein